MSWVPTVDGIGWWLAYNSLQKSALLLQITLPGHQFVGGRGPQPQTQSIAHRLDLFLGAMRHRAGQELVVLRVLLTALTVRKNKGEKEQGEKNKMWWYVFRRRKNMCLADMNLKETMVLRGKCVILIDFNEHQ